MRLFGIYKGYVYLLLSDITFQGFSQYRDVSPAMCYGPHGFSVPLNAINTDGDIENTPNWYKGVPIAFRGIHSARISPDGDILVTNRWVNQDPNSRGKVDMFEHPHGNLSNAVCQWYGLDNDSINSMVAMLKFYDPETLDQNFISKLRFMDNIHESMVVYKIAVSDFVNTMWAYLKGESPQNLLSAWEKIEINIPVSIVDVKFDDLGEFNASDVVYWNRWYKSSKEQTPPEPMESLEELPVEKKPRLVEDSEDENKVA